MTILLYVLSVVFFLYGGLILFGAATSKKLTHMIGGLCFVLSSIIAITLNSFLPLLAGFSLAFVVRVILGDPWRGKSKLSESIEFKRISQNLSRPLKTYSDAEFETRERDQHKLFSLIELDRELNRIMKEHNIEIEELEKIYERLIIAGAGQRVNSVWVPAAALASPYTLSYLVTRFTDDGVLEESEKPSENDRRIAFQIVDYFENENPLR